MWEIKRSRTHRRPLTAVRAAGATAVEFAVVVPVFLLLVFGIIELARVMYIYHTLAEVTRLAARAAVNISFNDTAALDQARKRAVFDELGGQLPFGHPITYENIRIEYLYLGATALQLQKIPPGAMPSCPARNRLNCMIDPNGSNCIRAVQASICTVGSASGTCTPVSYQPIIPVVPLSIRLPISLTIMSAETLGYRTGDNPCP